MIKFGVKRSELKEWRWHWDTVCYRTFEGGDIQYSTSRIEFRVSGLRNWWGGCVYVLQMIFLFFFLFISVCHKIWDSGTAERIFVKLLPNDRGESGVSNFLPKGGLGTQTIFWGLKTAKSIKIAIGAYSSELITPEQKRISQRLKRPWNHKTVAYKVYVRPWPLTPR